MNTETEVLNALLEIMQEEHELVIQLLDFSLQKKALLVEGRDHEISDLLKQEGNVVGEISEKEQQRKQLVSTIAASVDGLSDQATLNEITESIKDAHWKKSLIDVRGRLTKAVAQVTAENRKVNMLLRRKLQYTDMMLDLLLVPDTMINLSYDAKGKRETEDVVRSGFLDVYI